MNKPVEKENLNIQSKPFVLGNKSSAIEHSAEISKKEEQVLNELPDNSGSST